MEETDRSSCLIAQTAIAIAIAIAAAAAAATTAAATLLLLLLQRKSVFASGLLRTCRSNKYGLSATREIKYLSV